VRGAAAPFSEGRLLAHDDGCGAYLYAFSDTHRLDIMAPGICNPNDTEEVFAAVTITL
jgi:hypothetical protein